MRTQKLQEAENEYKILTVLLQKIYEDKVCGDLMEEWFVTMRKFYKQEQQKLKEMLKAKVKASERTVIQRNSVYTLG